MSAYKYIRVAAHAPNVTVLSLSRPKQKNAFNLGMYDEVTRALRELSSSTAPSAANIILTGEGDYYSSGNDLANFSQLMHPKTMAASAKKVCYEFVDAFASCTKPIVCAANGPAIGIAMTTMGLCDVRICRPSSWFHTPFKALGQAPEGCSSFMFPRICGPDVARQLLDEGRKLSSAEALSVGFVHRVVPDDVDLISAAVEEIRSGGSRAAGAAAAAESGSASTAPAALRRFTKDEPGLLVILRAVNQREVDVLEEAWVSRECFDALAAYLQSRKKNGPALVLKALNMTRWAWDR